MRRDRYRAAGRALPPPHGVVVAAVVSHTERVGVREGGCSNQVSAAQRDPVEPVGARRKIDQPFDDEHDLRPAGAPIRAGRGGVAQHRPRPRIDHRNIVEARHQLGAFGQRHERGGIGAEIAEVRGAQRQEIAVGVQSELRLDLQIAGLVVAEKRLLPVTRPFDRAAKPARAPGDERKLWIRGIARAEITADISGDDAHLLLWQAQHGGHILPRPPYAAAACVKRNAAAHEIELGQRGPRLHRYAGHALYPGRQAHDAFGAGERRRGGRVIADTGFEHDIRTEIVGQQRSVLLGCRRGAGRGSQGLIVDLDVLHGISGGSKRLGDDESHGFAGETRPLDRQRELPADRTRHPVESLETYIGRMAGRRGIGHRSETVGQVIGARQNCQHIWHRDGVCRPDCAQPGMRVRRPDHEDVHLVRQIEIVAVAALAGQEPLVFEAPYRLPYNVAARARNRRRIKVHDVRSVPSIERGWEPKMQSLIRLTRGSKSHM